MKTIRFNLGLLISCLVPSICLTQATTSTAAACKIRGVPLEANAIAVATNGNVFVGGFFQSAGETNTERVAMWNPSVRKWSRLGAASQGPASCGPLVEEAGEVRVLYIGANNVVYAGGDFTDFKASGSASYLSLVNPSTETWFNLGAIGSSSFAGPIVNGIDLWSGQVAIAGRFTSIGGDAVTNVAVYNASSGHWSNRGPTPMATVLKLKVFNGTAYICGTGGIFRFDDRTPWVSVHANYTGTVNDFIHGTYQGHDGIYFVGSRSIYAEDGLHFVDFSTGTTTLLENNTLVNNHAIMHTLTLLGTNKVVIGGELNEFSVIPVPGGPGKRANGIAQFDINTGAWGLIGGNTPNNGALYFVRALATAPNLANPTNNSPLLYVGGDFSQVGDDQICVKNIAVWDSGSSTWSILADNEAPTVSITAPADGSVFPSSADVVISANASDDCLITNISFYADSVLLGSVSQVPASFTWVDPPAGTHVLTVVAFDNEGVSTTSAPVQVRIGPPPCAPVPAGLVSWWRGETNADDFMGLNNGTLVGGVTFVSGMVGQAFHFDGSNSYVRIPASSSLGFSNELTIEFWYKAEASGNQGLVARRNNESGPLNYEVAVTPGVQIDAFFNDPLVSGDTDQSGTMFELSRAVPAPGVGSFHHLAVSYRQATVNTVEVKTYLDGQLVRTRSFTASLGNAVNSGSSVTIGAEAEYPNGWFKGVIDEVSMYSRALTQSEIQSIYAAGSAGKCLACAPVPAGLVSWWRGEGNADDFMGLNNGTLVGGVTFVSGMVGQAFHFDGSNSYVRIPASSSLGFSNELTIEFWYNAEASGNQGLVARRNDEFGPLNYEVAVTPGVQLDAFFNDPSVYGDSDQSGTMFELSRTVPAPAIGTFYHLAVSYRQATTNTVEVKTYLDGQLVRTRVFTANLGQAVNSDSSVTIGAEAEYPNGWFAGIIDEVSMYNRALTQSEIQAIYAAGAGGKCMSP